MAKFFDSARVRVRFSSVDMSEPKKEDQQLLGKIRALAKINWEKKD